jgi:predicted RNase H-like nuclease
MSEFRTFIGVDLGGGKGKNTAVARLELGPGGVRVVDYGTGKDAPWYDDRLIAYLRQHADGAVVAIDAPLTMPSCVRCTIPVCATQELCEVPIVTWFRERENGARVAGKKPRYTPYTQRATEVILHEDHQILPRETLGQGMGPLAARGAYLHRALGATHRLNENLIEVYPKATVMKLFPRMAGRYKRSAESPRVRLDIFNGLPDLSFAPGAWREDGLANDHKFDAIICAYTAYLWWRGECEQPVNPTVLDDGWIWFPRRPAAV